LLIAGALAAWLWPRAQGSAGNGDAGGSLVDALGAGQSAGYRVVTGPRRLVFPRDDGPHPGYRDEWWYFTGNLETAAGRHFGFELTFFRVALAPGKARGTADWSGHQVYMAHLAITDVRDDRFRYRERVSRTGPGIAGARAPTAKRPFRVWLHDWSATGKRPGRLFPLTLSAGSDALGVQLNLHSEKPPVLQGDHGYSRKGPAPGEASYYYSFTRLATRGRLRIGGRTFRVTGTSWMDHEWSSSVLDHSQVGWDWFALHLDDGRDLMFYRLRRRDGQPSRYTYAIVVDPRGRVRHLDAARVHLEVTGHWQSPHSGTDYPSGWRLTLRPLGLTLRVRPMIRDQELRGIVNYWEGAVDVSGQGRHGTVRGQGYVELTGYGRNTDAGAGGSGR